MCGSLYSLYGIYDISREASMEREHFAVHTCLIFPIVLALGWLAIFLALSFLVHSGRQSWTLMLCSNFAFQKQ